MKEREGQRNTRCGFDDALQSKAERLPRQPTGDDSPAERISDPRLRTCCPNCRVSIRLADDQEFDEVHCSSCGTRFSLVSVASTATYDEGDAKTIGHFTLAQRVGIGAFGTVWRAEDSRLDRTVAVKLPRKGQLSKKETEKFLREARAAAQLNHPNIVSVHEAGRCDQTVYIVSDFIEGLTLSDWLTGQRPTAATSAMLLTKIADALHHAHQQGVIHRDLKPGNILLDRLNEPHLTDFGLARREAGEVTMTMDGEIIGTPAYMSPEQACGEAHAADARSDIYSLGVILFELLTGERPFRGNARMLLHQIQTEEAPSPRKYNSAIPKDIETICLKCLQREPSRRYQSAEAVGSDLQSFLRGEAITARPIGLLERGWRWCKRRPAIAAMSIALVFALVSGAVTSSYYAFSANERAEELAITVIEKEAQRRRADENANKFQKAAQVARSSEARARDSEAATRKLLYRSEMREALAAKSTNDVARIRKLLLNHVPVETQGDNRDFIWFHLWDYIHPYQQLLPHGSSVMALDVTEDGRFIASGGYDGDIKIWERETGKLVSFFRVPFRIRELDFSPDGAHLIAGSRLKSTFHVWDWREGLPHVSIPAQESVWVSAAWSPDGRSIAVSEGSGSADVGIYDAESGDELNRLQANSHWLDNLCFSPNGEFLSGSDSVDGSVLIFEIKTGQQVRLPGSQSASWEQGWDLQFSPNNSLVASSGPAGIHVWNRESGDLLQRFPLSEFSAMEMVFSSDGKKIFATGERAISICDLETGRTIRQCAGHTGRIQAIRLTQNERYLLTGADDGLVLVRDLRSVKKLMIPKRELLFGTGFQMGNGNDAYVQTTSTVLRCDARTGSLEQISLEKGQFGYAGFFAVDPEGTKVAYSYSEGDIVVFDLKDGNLMHRIPQPGFEAGVYKLPVPIAFSPDGQLLATSQRNGQIRFYDTESFSLRQIENGAGSRELVVFSPDGEWFACPNKSPGNGRCHVELNGMSNGKVLNRNNHAGVIYSALAFSHDSRWIASGGEDAAIRISAVDDDQDASKLLLGHEGEVTSVSFSPDDDILASASTDGTVRLWDVVTTELLGVLCQVSAEELRPAVDFSSDGQVVVTCDSQQLVFHRACSRDEADFSISLERDLQSGDMLGILEQINAMRPESGLELPIGFRFYLEAKERLEYGDSTDCLKLLRQGDKALSSMDDPDNSHAVSPSISHQRTIVAYRMAFLRAAALLEQGDEKQFLRQCQMALTIRDKIPKEFWYSPFCQLDQVERKAFATYRNRVQQYTEYVKDPRTLMGELFKAGAVVKAQDSSGRIKSFAHSDELPDNLDTIIGVLNLQGHGITSAEIRALGENHELKTLQMFSPPPELLSELPVLRHLESIQISRTEIGEDSMQAIAKCENLRSFNINMCSLEQHAWRGLQDSQRLQNLRVSGSSLESSGLAYLSGVASLKRLSIVDSGIEDSHLAAIGDLSELVTLDLSFNAISDQGVPSLSHLKQLRSLALQRTLITNGVAKELKPLDSLTSLDLRETSATELGVSAIRRCLPQCSVVIEDDLPGHVRTARKNVFAELDLARREFLHEETAGDSDVSTTTAAELRLGRALYHAGHRSQSVRVLQKTARLDNEAQELSKRLQDQLLLGHALQRSGRYAESAEALQSLKEWSVANSLPTDVVEAQLYWSSRHESEYRAALTAISNAERRWREGMSNDGQTSEEASEALRLALDAIANQEWRVRQGHWEVAVEMYQKRLAMQPDAITVAKLATVYAVDDRPKDYSELLATYGLPPHQEWNEEATQLALAWSLLPSQPLPEGLESLNAGKAPHSEVWPAIAQAWVALRQQMPRRTQQLLKDLEVGDDVPAQILRDLLNGTAAYELEEIDQFVQSIEAAEDRLDQLPDPAGFKLTENWQKVVACYLLYQEIREKFFGVARSPHELAARKFRQRLTALDAMETPPPDEVFQALHDLGRELVQLRESVAAETHLRRAVKTRVANVGPDDKKLIHTHTQLSHALRQQGRSAEAYQVFMEANRIRELHAKDFSEREKANYAWAKEHIKRLRRELAQAKQ